MLGVCTTSAAAGPRCTAARSNVRALAAFCPPAPFPGAPRRPAAAAAQPAERSLASPPTAPAAPAAAPPAPAAAALLERALLLAAPPRGDAAAALALAALVGALALGAAGPAAAAMDAADAGALGLDTAAYSAAHAPALLVGDLAEGEEFWSNVGRYASYFFSVLLGTAYTALRPVAAALKRPGTAVLVIAGAAGLYIFVSSTVSAMLGINEVPYEPSSIVTPQL
jgi:hypothetical protein